jgi:hypothetical protein
MRVYPLATRTAGAIAFMLMTVLAHANTAQAGGCGCDMCSGYAGYAAGGCGGPAFALVERTIYVPTTEMERRTVNVTEFRPEVRQRTITVNRCIPETQEVRETYTVLTPEVRVRTQRYIVHKPVWREEDRTFTVNVPHQELRQGVRHVCRQVQVQELRDVTRDQGHWEDVLCNDSHGGGGYGCGDGCGSYGRRRLFRGCGGCGGCGGCDNGCGGGYDGGCGNAVAQHVHRVWRPNYVTEQVPVTVWRNQMTEEPYEYTVTVCRPETQTRRVKVVEYVPEERTRDVQYMVCVPQQRERVRNVTMYRMVAEQHQQNYTAHVPHTVSKEVEVPVCRMVPKQVTYRVPIWDGGCGAGYGYGGCGAPCGGYP